MKEKDILKMVDHTNLKQFATWVDIKKLCDDAIKYSTASVCIAPCFVKQAKEYVGDKMKICTVIGFPNGYNTTEAKVFETRDALNNGADEIDMVINISKIKEKKFDEVLDEIKQIKEVCGKHILKVIVETCFLTKKEKIKMCEIINKAGADFIKTSTGFGLAGAKKEDIKLFKEELQNTNVRIKAAGGISDFQDANDFIEEGASRLGTSKLIK